MENVKEEEEEEEEEEGEGEGRRGGTPGRGESSVGHVGWVVYCQILCSLVAMETR